MSTNVRFITFQLAVCTAAMAVGSGCSSQSRSTPGSSSFQRSANRAPASILRTVTTRSEEGVSIGLASSSSLCGDRLFVVDPRNAVVHEIRLSDGLHLRVFGSHGDADGSLKSPETVVANCDMNIVVVQDGHNLLHYDMASGAFRGRTTRAATAGPALGFGFADGNSVIFPGYWVTDRAFFSRDPAHALAGFSIGYRVALDGGGASNPLLQVAAEGCRSMSSNCLDVGIDRIAEPQTGWIACQGGGSAEVGVYSPTGQLERRIDVRSPLFLDDGSTTKASSAVVDKLQWHQRNSAVRFCGAFDNYVAVVHYTLEPGEWSPGKAMTPRPLLNIHQLDGTPIVADLGLRDVPIAKDAHNLYVLVYGDSRKDSGGPTLELDTIQITDSHGVLNTRLLH